MALAPEDLEFMRRMIYYAYAGLWGRYRGLLAVLGERGIAVSERVEDEIELWVRDHRQELFPEAAERFRDYVLRLLEPGEHPAPDPPPPAS